jgi:hypothetical protein
MVPKSGNNVPAPSGQLLMQDFGIPEHYFKVCALLPIRNMRHDG